MLPVERRLAVRQAWFESCLGTPGRFPHWAKSDEENGDAESFHMRLWWKLKKNVWNICLVLYSLFVAKIEKWESISLSLISNNTCLPIRSCWMQAPTWPSDKQLLLLSKSFLLDIISNSRYCLQIISFLLGSTFVANCNLKLWVA